MPKLTGIPDVRFNLKSIKDRNKPTLISAVFRYPFENKTVKLVYSTRLKIEPKHWDAKKQLPRTTHPQYNHFKKAIQKLGDTIQSIYLDSGPGNISVKDFKFEIDLRLGRVEIVEEAKPTLLSFIEAFIERKQNEIAANRNTWKKFVTVKNHLINYADEQLAGVLDFDDIDWKFRDHFVNWLYSSPRNHSVNNASKIVKVLKQFMSESFRENLHANTTFQDRQFSVRPERIKKVVLSFDDIKKIHDLDLSDKPKLDRVRDLFLIGCYTGLRISDFTRLKPEHIISDNGVEMIHMFTSKTKTEVYIPITSELKQILVKRGHRSPDPISSQRMNEYIKDLCEEAKLNTPTVIKYSEGGRIKEKTVPLYTLCTSHTARRSWATHYYSLGIPSAYLRQITGHSSDQMLMRYINVDKKKAAHEMVKQVADIMKSQNRNE